MWYFAAWFISSYFVPVKVVFCSSVNPTLFNNASVFKYASTLLFLIFPLMHENQPLFFGATSLSLVQIPPCLGKKTRYLCTKLGDRWQPSLGQQRFIFLTKHCNPDVGNKTGYCWGDICAIVGQVWGNKPVFSRWTAAGEFKLDTTTDVPSADQ